MLLGMIAGAGATPVAAHGCSGDDISDDDDVDVDNKGGNVVVDYEDRSDDDGFDDKDFFDIV